MEELIDVRSLISKIQSDKQEAIELGVLKKEKKLDDIHKNEIPYSLPDGWEWIRLGDYAFKITDYVASGSFASLKENVLITNEPNYAIMVKTADFSNNFSKNLTYTDEHGYTFLSNSNLFGGELILSNIGSIGKVFIVPNLGVPMTLASNTVMVKMSDKKLIKYLYYFFLSPLGQRTLKNISSGTSMMKFNKTQLKNIIVPIAPLKQQQNIVQLFDRLSILIENQKTQLKLLDELVKARFVEMFGDPVSNSKDLPVQKMNNVAPICQYDGSFEESVWLLNLDMVESQTGRIINYNIVSKDEIGGSVCTFDENNVLYSKLRPYLNKVVIPDGKGYATSELVPLRPDPKIINRIYLAYLLRSNEFVEMIKEKVAGAKMPRVSMSDFREFKVPVPPLELQNQFASFVEEIDKSRLRELLAIKHIKLLLNDSWLLFY